MFRWWRDWRKKKRALSEYREAVFLAVLDNSISAEEKDQLVRIVSQNNLVQGDLLDIQREAFQGVFGNVVADNRISDQEVLFLNQLVDLFGVEPKELGLDQSQFNSARYLELLDRGELITIKERPSEVNIPEGESLHFFAAAAVAKRRRVTSRVGYAGPTVSIKITKGVHYRAGSFNLAKATKETLSYEDFGFLFVTDKQVGYKGPKKQLNIPLKKLNYVEINDGVLSLFVSGRENPHLFFMSDYQLALGVLSVLINR